MNNIKTKVSFLLFVIFIALYSTMYNPKLYFISFLATTFFILLEKTQLLKGKLPFVIPYRPIIITGFLLFGFLYLYNKYFKREGFQTETVNKTDTKMNEIEKKLGKKLTKDLEQHINNLLKKRDEVHTLSMKKFQEDVKLQLNFEKQNLNFNERKYKVQKEIEENENKKAKKMTPLDKKNLLLFKQNLVKHIPNIIDEFKTNVNTAMSDNEFKKLSLFDKLLKITKDSFTILGKEDRMVYVGTSSLIISFALMLFDISL